MCAYFESRYTFDRGRLRVWKAIAEYLQRFVNPTDTVFEMGAGYCDFINLIRAGKKFAVDIDPSAAAHAGTDVVFHVGSCESLPMVADGAVDVVFASNLLEHFADATLVCVVAEARRILKNDGIFIVLQPNYRYCAKEYFDDFTHKKVFSHVSLVDFMKANGFSAIAVHRRFMPFSFKSHFPKSYLLTSLYLRLPIKPFAKQMLIVFKKIEHV